MLTKRKRRILFFISIGAFVALLVPIFLYSFGYGIGPGFVIQKTGSIAIIASESGALVSVEHAKPRETSLLAKAALIKPVVPGNYEVAVEKKEFWPWRRNLAVFSERVTARDVVLIPLTIPGKQVGSSTPFEWKERVAREPYIQLRALFSSVKKFWSLQDGNDFLILGDDGKFYKNREKFDPASLLTLESDEKYAAEIFTDLLTSAKNSFFSKNKDRVVFWDRYSIDSYWMKALDTMPEWQRDGVENTPLRLMHIFSAPDVLRKVLPYPERDNYLIVETQNGIFALEMEFPHNNIAPLYKGKRPKIISVFERTMLISDDNTFIEIKLP